MRHGRCIGGMQLDYSQVCTWRGIRLSRPCHIFVHLYGDLGNARHFLASLVVQIGLSAPAATSLDYPTDLTRSAAAELIHPDARPPGGPSTRFCESLQAISAAEYHLCLRRGPHPSSSLGKNHAATTTGIDSAKAAIAMYPMTSEYLRSVYCQRTGQNRATE